MATQFLWKNVLAATVLVSSLSGTALAQSAFVTGMYSGAVSQIDLATNTVVATIPLDAMLFDVAVTPDGRTAYVSEPHGEVAVIDAASHALTATIPLGAGSEPWGITVTPDGRYVYVTDELHDRVDVISTASNTIVGQIAVGSAPFAVAISPDGKRGYVANQASNNVSVLDTETLGVIATFIVGGAPSGIAVSADSSRVYVTALTGNGIGIFDTSTNSLIAAIPAGRAPFGIVVTPDGAKAYVASSLESLVYVIDLVSNSISKTISVGVGPVGLAITPDGGKVYAANLGPPNAAPANVGDTVSVIETASDTVIDTITAVPSTTKIAMAEPNGLVASVLPSGRSVQLGSNATLFATMLNTNAASVGGCRIGLPASAPAGLSLSYQATDPATNAPVGAADPVFSVAGNGGSQSFVLSFAASDALSASEQQLDFSCSGILPVVPIAGVNTIDLRFSSQPMPDIVALAATPTGNGIVTIPQSTGGAAAFAIASVNVGAAGTLTIGTDAASPLTAMLCQTDPATAACLAPMAATVSVDYTAGATPTFSVFLTASAPIALDPAANRLAVTFSDGGGNLLARTSVAVDTN